MTLSSFVYYPNPVIAAKRSSLIRQAPRVPELRQSDYTEKFDYTTIFYDVFQSDDKIIFSGPPLRNNLKKFQSATVTDERGLALEAHFGNVDRTQRSWAENSNPVNYIGIDVGSSQITATVGGDLRNIFRGRKVLLTKSKDNDLGWIHDWAKFYVVNHAIDSILIYDNGSSTYSPEDVVAALSTIFGLKKVVVVSWPYKFGPQGGNWGGVRDAPWDSDYCEYGILEHAKYRFLEAADYVAHFDIDELLVSDSGSSALETIGDFDTAGALFSGKWIDSATESQSENISFRDYLYHDSISKPTTKKWVIRPVRVDKSNQWKTHYVQNLELPNLAGYSHRHFLGITSNWKYNRTNDATVIGSTHSVDRSLKESIQRADAAESIVWPWKPGATGASEVCKAIQSDLAELVPSNDAWTKVWIYKDKCVVVDVNIDGRLFGIDIVTSDSQIHISVVGRNAISMDAVNQLIRLGYGGTKQKSDRLRLAHVFRASTRLALVAELKGCIDRILSALRDGVQRSLPENSDSGSSTAGETVGTTNVYWWAGKPNFGDLIGPLLVEKMTGMTPLNIKGNLAFGKGLVTVGSLLNHLDRPNLEVWGSGLIRPIADSEIENMRSRLPKKFHAVRGALTRDELTGKLGADVPEIYGDPALLLAEYFEPDEGLVRESGQPVAVLHYQHASMWTEPMSEVARFVDVAQPTELVVSEIALASHVVSSSLHGIIVAEAYGVPWTWLRSGDNPLYGDRFKFDDFFTVIDETAVSELAFMKNSFSVDTLRSAINSARLPQLNFDPSPLIEAFPFELS